MQIIDLIRDLCLELIADCYNSIPRRQIIQFENEPRFYRDTSPKTWPVSTWQDAQHQIKANRSKSKQIKSTRRPHFTPTWLHNMLIKRHYNGWCPGCGDQPPTASGDPKGCSCFGKQPGGSTVALDPVIPLLGVYTRKIKTGTHTTS